MMETPTQGAAGERTSAARATPPNAFRDAAAAQRRSLALDRRLFLFALVIHTGPQLAPLMGQLPLGERLQRLSSIALMVAYWGLPSVAPAFYLRHRTALMLLQRLIYFAYPLLRQPKGEAGLVKVRRPCTCRLPLPPHRAAHPLCARSPPPPPAAQASSACWRQRPRLGH